MTTQTSSLPHALRLATVAALTVLAGASATHAQTVAYYRFENGVNGQAVTPPVVDQTGNNPLTVEAGANVEYSNVVSSAKVPQTGAANTLSLNFTPTSPAKGLVSTSSETAFNNFNYSSWTIEASVEFSSFSGTGFDTFVGKDGSSSGSPADFYLQRNGRNDGFSVLYLDAKGNQEGFDSTFIPQTNVWYNVAAVYSGSVISLYVNGQLIQSAAATPLVVDNNPWTIGRGFFDGAQVDTFAGYVDEVRFSSTALTPSQFLGSAASAPEPGALALLAAFATPLAVLVRLRRSRTSPRRQASL